MTTEEELKKQADLLVEVLKKKAKKTQKRSNTKVVSGLNKDLKNASGEKDVENAYRGCFGSLYPGCISSPGGVDGLFEHPEFSFILEFKDDVDLRNAFKRADPLTQVLFYLKAIQDLGKKLPGAIFIGDKNKCFCEPTSELIPYFNEPDIDWSVAPSSAAKKYPDLVAKISDDEKIHPFIYSVDENFDFLSVVEKLKKISQGKKYAVTITDKNIVEIYRRFEKDVVTDKKLKVLDALFDEENDKKRMNEMVDVFFTCLTNREEAYIHPKKKNIVVVRGKNIGMNVDNFRTFFSEFRQEYLPKELEKLTANKDRILEDIYRRRTGAYFTPDLWVAEAHKMIADAFGDNWKEEYVVWDCAAGTANLTRGYNFKELYISTIEESDINTIKDCKYNNGATIFKCDFLNELGIESVPQNLKDCFAQGKKVLFLINPPYGTASNLGTKEDNHKADISKNAVNSDMLKDKMGFAARNLYCQFIFKLAKLSQKYKGQIFLSIFAPPLFITSKSNSTLRGLINSTMEFVSGMLLQSSNFSDVSRQWGISFTIWKPTTVLNKSEKMDLSLSLKELDNETFEVKQFGKKTVYSPDELASEWVREEIKGRDKTIAPNMTSSISVKEGDKKLHIGSIGCINNNSNNVYKNGTDVFMVSSCSSLNANISIIPENFRKVVALFSARKTIKPTWINCKDEYLVPDTSHADYEQWNNDCIIYSLFNNSSQQSSLRKVEYKNKKWDIRNNFFFMSNAEMMDLANVNNFSDMYQDAKIFPKEAYVYTLLQNTILSDDAKLVLAIAKELIKKSMTKRKDFHENNPEYHLNAWDAGWAQLKLMLKIYFKEEYDKFVKLYKDFEDRIREGVYKFGFLEK